MRQLRLRHPRGSTLIWTLVVLTLLTGFCSLAVDWGRVQLVKTELRLTADAAARYAAPALGDGIQAVRSRARTVAADNVADGTPVVLADADVEQGRWAPDTKTFVPNGTPVDAVRITARRAGANAVPLMFARILGRATADVSASAVVVAPQSLVGFTGLNGITFKNNTFIGSYDSASVTKPNSSQSTGKSLISSNSTIEAHNHVELDGNVVIGPAGSVSGVTVEGKTTKKPTAIAAPPSPAAGTGTNPLGLPADYTVSTATVLPAGTYRFTALAVNANLSFSGVAVVHVNGDISIDNKTSITAYQGRPSNLKIYQTGANRSFYANNDFEITACIIAPNSNFVANNKLTFYGTAVFQSIEAKNNADVFVDERAMSEAVSGGGLVQ